MIKVVKWKLCFCFCSQMLWPHSPGIRKNKKKRPAVKVKMLELKIACDSSYQPSKSPQISVNIAFSLKLSRLRSFALDHKMVVTVPCGPSFCTTTHSSSQPLQVALYVPYDLVVLLGPGPNNTGTDCYECECKCDCEWAIVQLC